MNDKPLHEAETPAEMRAAIEAGKRDNMIIARVLDHARYSGLSAEDTYSMLAYHALNQLSQANAHLLEFYNLAPPPSIILNKNWRPE